MSKRAAGWVLGFGVMGLVASLGAGTPVLASSPQQEGSRDSFSVRNGGFSDVHAVSASDAWAVGSFENLAAGAWRVLTAHWDGTSWTRVPSPPGGSHQGSAMYAVSAASATDVWAVGATESPDCFTQRTLIVHWDGTSWTREPSPSPNGGCDQTQLTDVSAVSATDAWAVGVVDDGQAQKSYILHWDGTSWTRMPGPDPWTAVNLYSVSAVSATDAWAVGDYLNRAGGGWRTLIVHWDGTSWTRVPSPLGESKKATLAGVSAVSATDAWAVGRVANSTTGQQRTLILHWDGTSWTRVPSPATANDSALER